jgi:hypothetical protein
MDNNYIINTHYQVLSQVENIASEALINVLRIGEELVERVECVRCVCLSVCLSLSRCMRVEICTHVCVCMCMHIDTWNKPAMRVGALLSQAGDIAQKEIEEAKERMAKFAPGGPGTEQVFFLICSQGSWH